MVNPAEMGGRRPGQKPSNFSVTCSLLSQYLKEKGSFGDLNLGMTAAVGGPPAADGRGKPETLRTMNLLPAMEAARGGGHSAGNKDATSDRRRSMDLFPQRASFGPLYSENKPDLNREHRAGTGQMTIFYGGKVVVFDNLPADKARQLMAMAGGGCPENAQIFRAEQPGPSPVMLPQRPSGPPAKHNSAAAILASISEPNRPAAPAPCAAPTSAVVAQEAQQNPPQPAASDLPIARRVSLHRFLEKRKDRIHAKAPYQLNGAAGSPAAPFSAPPPAKPEESRHWLGLAPQASKPDGLQKWPAGTKDPTSSDICQR